MRKRAKSGFIEPFFRLETVEENKSVPERLSKTFRAFFVIFGLNGYLSRIFQKPFQSFLGAFK